MTLRFVKLAFKKPQYVLVALLERFGSWLSDKRYIDIKFRLLLGYKICFDAPRTFNEKLNWLKLYDRHDFYTMMADKYIVKEYVKERIGGEYVVPLLGVWQNADEINVDSLPSEFVLKATHDSSGAMICNDKAHFNVSNAVKHFRKLLKRDYFYSCREWPYKNITHRVIAETLLKSGCSESPMVDYKFMCFDGIPKLMYCTIKGGDVYENFYDMDFNPIYISHGFPRRQPEFEKPSSFTMMRTLAEKLSQNIPFVRIDFYEVEGKVFFGEFTFYDWGGFKAFNDISWDYKLGEWIKLPTLR